MDDKTVVDAAIDALAERFASLDLTFHPMEGAQPGDVTSYWPGGEDEDVMVCVFGGTDIREPYHRQDFFFINYAWRNSYQALSDDESNLVTIGEGDCYIGQPYSGYALRAHDREGVAIVGVLIRRDAFLHEFLPTVYADPVLFDFFIGPQRERFADQFIHLPASDDWEASAIRTILGAMAVEYANRSEGSQPILKSLLQTLLLRLARQHRRLRIPDHDTSDVVEQQPVSAQILTYMADHPDVVTLQSLANHFGYNPNYLSTLIHKETGHTFSQILLSKRMERAAMLLKNTTLTADEIAAMIGYTDHSNFHKAFKAHYGMTPREFAHRT